MRHICVEIAYITTFSVQDIDDKDEKVNNWMWNNEFLNAEKLFCLKDEHSTECIVFENNIFKNTEKKRKQ